MPLDQARRPMFTAAEQAEARAALSRMGVREHRDPSAAYLVLAFLGQALAYGLLVTDSGDRAWLRRAAAVHEAWIALPAFTPPRVDDLGTPLRGPDTGDVPPLPPATRCVACTGAIAIAPTPSGWRHLDVVDALAGDHDARAEVAL